MTISRILHSLLIPLIILSCGLWLIYHDDILPEILVPILVYLPFASAIVIVLIAYQFNLYRLFTLACLMASWYFLTDFQSIDTAILTPNQQQLLIWLLPIGLIGLGWLPERGIRTLYGIIGWLVIAVVVAAAVYVSQTEFYKTILQSGFQWYKPVSWLILAILVVASVHQIVKIWRRDSVIDGVMLITIIAISWYYIFPVPSELSKILLHNIFQILIVWGLIKHSHDLAYRDELTVLPSRRALNEWLKAPGRKYVIAMLDIDHFKKFNDRYGHDVGDDVLKVVASRLNRITGGGRAFRYGGEEFTIVFSGKDSHECTPHLEAVREDIAHYKISLRETKQRPKSANKGRKQRGRGYQGKRISVTISIGVAARTAERNVEQVIKAADKALYKAKKAGRNCLVADKSK